MMRVERLVTPLPKSFCSTNRVRLPARAHSRATATPLMPPPMTTTWKCRPSNEGRGLTAKLMISRQISATDPHAPGRCGFAQCAQFDSPPVFALEVGHLSPENCWEESPTTNDTESNFPLEVRLSSNRHKCTFPSARAGCGAFLPSDQGAALGCGPDWSRLAGSRPPRGARNGGVFPVMEE